MTLELDTAPTVPATPSIAAGKRVLTVTLRWDYGRPERGESCEQHFFVRNLRLLGADVSSFWFDEHMDDEARLQRELLDAVERFQPDLVFFVLFQEQVHVETIRSISERVPTAVWFCDDSWRLESHSLRYAPAFTHVITTDPYAVPKYRAAGIEPILTQWAAQLMGGPCPPLASDGEFLHDASFIGGADPWRRWFVSRLRSAGIDVACYGTGWERGRTTYEQMETVLHRSRINLNISNSASHDVRFTFSGLRALHAVLRSPKRGEQIKARNFEIPAAGGFQLTNYARGLERYLQVGSEVAIYTTPEDCAEQIRYYLEHEDERHAVATAGWERTLREHTYAVRLESVLGAVWQPA